MNNKKIYLKIIKILHSESSKSTIYYSNNTFKIIRYKNDNKIINYEAKTLKKLYHSLLKDFKIL